MVSDHHIPVESCAGWTSSKIRLQDLSKVRAKTPIARVAMRMNFQVGSLCMSIFYIADISMGSSGQGHPAFGIYCTSPLIQALAD